MGAIRLQRITSVIACRGTGISGGATERFGAEGAKVCMAGLRENEAEAGLYNYEDMKGLWKRRFPTGMV